MTKEEAIKLLKELKQSDDTELAHVEADAILCDLLLTLGYGDVVRAWEDLDKWYA